jgi:hypothetical protein
MNIDCVCLTGASIPRSQNVPVHAEPRVPNHSATQPLFYGVFVSCCSMNADPPLGHNVTLRDLSESPSEYGSQPSAQHSAQARHPSWAAFRGKTSRPFVRVRLGN